MYLQKITTYQASKKVREDSNSILYKGIMVFTIIRLKQSISFDFQAMPYPAITGEWLWPKMANCIEPKGDAGFTEELVSLL